MSNETVQCIYRNAVPSNKDLTPEEVLLACDAQGRLIKKRGYTIHGDGSRSNEISYRLWCRDPVGWMHSPEGVRYRKKMDAWKLNEYWGKELGYGAAEETIHETEKKVEQEYRDWYADAYPENKSVDAYEPFIGEAGASTTSTGILLGGLVVLIALALTLGRKR